MITFDSTNLHGTLINWLFGVKNFESTITHGNTYFILWVNTNLPDNFLIQIPLLSLPDSISNIIIEDKLSIGNKDDIIFHISSLFNRAQGMLIKEDNLLNLDEFMIAEGVTAERFY